MAARKAIQTTEKTTTMQNEEDAPSQSFTDVARKITGGDPPTWLVDTLKNWAPCLAIDRGVAFRQPGRSEMKKKLRGVRDAASLIVSALHDGATRDFLDVAPPGDILYHGQIDHMLGDLVRRAEHGIDSISTADGKTKAGRNKAVPPDAFHPKTLCAALILEAWTFVHEVEPVPKNQEAAAAADLFWNVSMEDLRIEPVKERIEQIVAKEAKSWGERLNGWRHHFEQAKEPTVSKIRQEIRRQLKGGKHLAGILAGDKSA
jgi:hypothetical protein